MSKKFYLKKIKHTVLYLVSVGIIVWAYYSNVQYNESQGIDALSGATQTENQ
ncbi:MAG: hypothetical protein LIO93_10150 [Bacteroidales bacterium]|nr:hypothetical protein [Bacteroidales bacterium]